MKSSRLNGCKIAGLLTVPVLVLCLAIVAPFTFGISSPFDLCGMIDAGSRATSLSFLCRGVIYADGIPSGTWQSKLPFLGQVDGCSPHFCLDPQSLNYLIDDQPLSCVSLAYDYAPNASEAHMNRILDQMLRRSDLKGEAGRTVEQYPEWRRMELRRVGKIENQGRAAYWQAWATRDKSKNGHTTYMLTVYTKDGIKDNVDDFASSKLGIPKTKRSAQADGNL